MSGSGPNSLGCVSRINKHTHFKLLAAAAQGPFGNLVGWHCSNPHQMFWKFRGPFECIMVHSKPWLSSAHRNLHANLPQEFSGVFEAVLQGDGSHYDNAHTFQTSIQKGLIFVDLELGELCGLSGTNVRPFQWESDSMTKLISKQIQAGSSSKHGPSCPK